MKTLNEKQLVQVMPIKTLQTNVSFDLNEDLFIKNAHEHTAQVLHSDKHHFYCLAVDFIYIQKSNPEVSKYARNTDEITLNNRRKHKHAMEMKFIFFRWFFVLKIN